MKMHEGSGLWARALHSGIAALLLVTFLTACGGGGSGDPFGSQDGTSDQSGGGGGGGNGGGGGSDSGGDSDDEEPGGVATAAIMRGTAAYDPGLSLTGVRVLNAAFSVLDANGEIIEGLDGGDFEIEHSTAPSEKHHDAQRLPYPGQLSGRIHLMLDISNSMAAHDFEKYKAEAVRFVEEMVDFGLDLEVYTFSDEGAPDNDAPSPTHLGSVSGGGDPSLVTDSIKAQVVKGVTTTRFVKIISTKVAELVALPWNQVSYPHAPLGDLTPPTLPTAQVELMVIISDGYDTTGSNFGEINTAKDEKFNIVSIAVGDRPNVSGLEQISEYLFTVPEDGDLSDAVSDAMAGIKNYYKSFYIVDYMPPAIEKSGKDTYSIKLVGNSGADLKVTYEPELIVDLLPVQPYCCKLRIAPGAPAGNPVSFAAGESVEFTAVQLWTAVQPDFSWTFTSDDNMSMEEDGKSVILSANRQSSGTISVQAGGWSVGPLNVEAH